MHPQANGDPRSGRVNRAVPRERVPTPGSVAVAGAVGIADSAHPRPATRYE
ncbi:MAG TPA: hypothetical protein VIT42_01570 [Microlunatus sp.]